MAIERKHTARTGERLVFIDVLRLIAAFQMIQGHAISAVLAPAYKTGLLFAGWSFARGLTSVMFLFTAGYAFALAEARSRREAAAAQRGRLGRVRRALWLIALGYAMHAPLAVLIGAPMEASLHAALRVDVLQCIGVSLLALELLSALLPDRGQRAGLSLLLGLATFLAAPLSAHVPIDGPWRALSNYVTSNGGSLFPLVPWLGYVWVGFGLGTATRDAPQRIPGVLALTGSCALVLGGTAWYVQARQPLALSPAYCLVKLACVLLIASALAWTCRGRRLPGLLAALAGETLFLYVSHVVILYADQVGLEARWRAQHSPWFGIALALSLLLGCGAGALWWRSLRPRLASGTRAPQTP